MEVFGLIQEFLLCQLQTGEIAQLVPSQACQACQAQQARQA